MKITIIGGGNLGYSLACRLSQHHQVYIFSNNFHKITNNVNLKTSIQNSIIEGKYITTDCIKEAIVNSDLIFITYPPHLFEYLVKILKPFIKGTEHFIFIPGGGGTEFQFKEFIDKGCSITGLERVPAICRFNDDLTEIQELSLSKNLSIASIPSNKSNEIKSLLENIYNIPVNIYSNYLSITLNNSNLILHTSRSYVLFNQTKLDAYFYKSWNITSSILLYLLDNELESIIQKLNLTMSNQICFTSILNHYEVTSTYELTKKISNIKSLSNIETPQINNNPDLESRYFKSDFTFGLDILISFADLLDIDCPNMKRVSDWYHKVNNDSRLNILTTNLIISLDMLSQIYR